MPREFPPREWIPRPPSSWLSTGPRESAIRGIVLVAVIVLIVAGAVHTPWASAAGKAPGTTNNLTAWRDGAASGPAALPSSVPIIPARSSTSEICANGTPGNPFPVSFLPYGYETPNLFGLGAGSKGFDHLCYTGGRTGVVNNTVRFTNVGGAGGVLGFPHVEYGQDLWGGSPGNMAAGFKLPEKDSVATHQDLWLTNAYATYDKGRAAYDYVWDNFLSSYVPNPANLSGPGNYSLEIMLWMTTGFEGSPWSYFTFDGSTRLPTLVNTTLSNQVWDFSYFCQGTNNNELTVLYFYNGTGGAMNTTSRTLGVNFSAVLVNVNELIHRTHEACWSSPANDDDKMYLDDLNLGSEFLTPYPSPYFGTAVFHWTISSMCFRFPRGAPRAANVSCTE